MRKEKPNFNLQRKFFNLDSETKVSKYFRDTKSVNRCLIRYKSVFEG